MGTRVGRWAGRPDGWVGGGRVVSVRVYGQAGGQVGREVSSRRVDRRVGSLLPGAEATTAMDAGAVGWAGDASSPSREPPCAQAFDLVSLREVACKIHQLNSQWSEAKKAQYVKHTVRGRGGAGHTGMGASARGYMPQRGQPTLLQPLLPRLPSALPSATPGIAVRVSMQGTCATHSVLPRRPAPGAGVPHPQAHAPPQASGGAQQRDA